MALTEEGLVKGPITEVKVRLKEPRGFPFNEITQRMNDREAFTTLGKGPGETGARAGAIEEGLPGTAEEPDLCQPTVQRGAQGSVTGAGRGTWKYHQCRRRGPGNQ